MPANSSAALARRQPRVKRIRPPRDAHTQLNPTGWCPLCYARCATRFGRGTSAVGTVPARRFSKRKELPMRGRTAAFMAASLITAGAVAATATAAGGPPPPPKAFNGAKVTLVTQAGSGLNTPTSFAFGGGNLFEGDGGAESVEGPQRRGLPAQGRNGDQAPELAAVRRRAHLAQGHALHQRRRARLQGSGVAPVGVERVERHHVRQADVDLYGAEGPRRAQRPRIWPRRPSVRRRRRRSAAA